MNETEINHVGNEGLRHDFLIRVPAANLGRRLESKISEIRPRMKLRGFRPGKAPVSHIRRIYGASLMDEIIGEALRESVTSALENADFRPAMEPEIEMTAPRDKIIEGDCDLECRMSVEAMPEFAPMDLSAIELSAPKPVPDDEEVRKTMSDLAGANTGFVSRAERKATQGDGVVIDFVGSVDGKEFAGGSAVDKMVVIGAGAMIDGFEDGLIGAVAGEQRRLQLCFPKDYASEFLQGREALFEVSVKDVREPEIPELDDDFAKKLGLENLRQLHDSLQRRVKADYDVRARRILKMRLFDLLDSAHDFALPEKMVAAELETIMSGSGEPQPERSDAEKLARRRVRLWLVLSGIGRAAGVEVRPDEMKRAIAVEASRYPGRENEVVSFINNDKEAAAKIRAPLFEEKVVDYIIERAKITEQTMTSAQFVELEQEIMSK